MKLKGINPIEQHIEKIVLGLVAVVLLGVFAMQFLTQPNQVNVGDRSVPPAGIYLELENQAKTLDSQLKDASPALPEIKQTDLVERYNLAFAPSADRPTALSAPLARGVNVGATVGAEITTASTTEAVSAAAVPATSAPMAVSQWATLDPYAVETVPAYKQFVPAQQPYDFASVSIEASFSGTALREALLADGGVPRRFWQGTGIAILGFEVERERLNADGSWSAAEPIVTPPGTPVPTVAMGEQSGLPELTEIVSKAASVMPEIVRPMGPPTIAGAEWLPPSERVEVSQSTLTESERLTRKLARLEADLERLQNPPSPRGTRDSDPYGGGGGGGKTPGNPGGGSDRDRDQPTNTGGGSNDRVQKKIEQLRAEIEKIREELRKLGEPAGTAPDAGRPGDPRRGPQTGNAAPDLLEQASVQLWAHDLGVEPGATYRYRTRVVINNPLFRKGGQLDENNAELQAAAKDPFARGSWSEWSAPVVVGAREYFFVSNADAQGALQGGRPSATIEVFRVFYGHYRKSTLTLAPGDRIEASQRTPEGLYLVDTALVVDPKVAAEVFAATERPASLPAGISQATGRISIDLGAYVLDVAMKPVPVMDAFGKEQTVSEVVLRTREGTVIARSGPSDTASPAYQLASVSASQASKTPLREPGQPAESPASGMFTPPQAQP